MKQQQASEGQQELAFVQVLKEHKGTPSAILVNGVRYTLDIKTKTKKTAKKS